MSKEYVKRRLSGIPKKDLDKAERQLHRWCDEFGIKEFALDAGAGDFREVVYRLLDLPPMKKEKKQRGRPIKHDRYFELKVISKLADYTFLNIDGNTLKGKKLYEKVAKDLNIKPEQKTGAEHDKEYTEPWQVVKGIDQRFDAKQEKLVSEHRLKNPPSEDIDDI